MKNSSNVRPKIRRNHIEHNNLILNGIILVIVTALLGVGIYYIVQAESSKKRPTPVRPYPRCSSNYIWSVDKQRCVRRYR